MGFRNTGPSMPYLRWGKGQGGSRRGEHGRHSLIHQLVAHSHIGSLTQICTLCRSLARPLTHALSSSLPLFLPHSVTLSFSLTNLITHSRTPTLPHSPPPPHPHSLTQLLPPFLTHLGTKTIRPLARTITMRASSSVALQGHGRNGDTGGLVGMAGDTGGLGGVVIRKGGHSRIVVE